MRALNYGLNQLTVSLGNGGAAYRSNKLSRDYKNTVTGSACVNLREGLSSYHARGVLVYLLIKSSAFDNVLSRIVKESALPANNLTDRIALNVQFVASITTVKGGLF